MAELSTLARPYAKAAFEYARERGALAAWSSQLAIVAAVAADERVAAMLDNPALVGASKAQRVNDICGDRTGTDVENVSTADAGRRHFVDRLTDLGSHRRRHRVAEEFDHRDQHKVRQHAAAHHQAGDTRADDIADTEKRRVVVRVDRAALEAFLREIVAG